MRNSLILAALAAALFAGPGTAAAADVFATSRPDTGASFAALSGVTAEAMSAAEMAAVEGRALRVSGSTTDGIRIQFLTLTGSDLGRGLGFPHPRCPGSPCGTAERLFGWVPL